MIATKTKNLYSNYKLALHPEKLNALRDGVVTAPIYCRIKPFNGCNHSCSWCGYGHGKPEGQSMHAEIQHKDSIPRDKMIEILEDLARIGTRAITWTGGGEPLAYKNFLEAQSLALKLGLDTSIITNGQLLTGVKAEVLRPAKWVRVSIDYWDAQSMANSRRVPTHWFGVVDKNLRDFSRGERGDFEINYIVTKHNYAHLYEAAMWLKDAGVDNVRFSPVWMDNFEEYHAPIRDTVENQLAEASLLDCDTFKVYSSYRIDRNAQTCMGSKCHFQQVVSVIGADMNVYCCKDKSYTTDGCIGSIKDQKFSALWFSPKAKQWFENFNPQDRCSGHQCAAAAKNRIYDELVSASGDNFV